MDMRKRELGLALIVPGGLVFVVVRWLLKWLVARPLATGRAA